MANQNTKLKKPYTRSQRLNITTLKCLVKKKKKDMNKKIETNIQCTNNNMKGTENRKIKRKPMKRKLDMRITTKTNNTF